MFMEELKQNVDVDIDNHKEELLLSLGNIKGKKYVIWGFKGISVNIFHEKTFLPMLISSKLISFRLFYSQSLSVTTIASVSFILPLWSGKRKHSHFKHYHL